MSRLYNQINHAKFRIFILKNNHVNIECWHQRIWHMPCIWWSPNQRFNVKTSIGHEGKWYCNEMWYYVPGSNFPTASIESSNTLQIEWSIKSTSCMRARTRSHAYCFKHGNYHQPWSYVSIWWYYYLGHKIGHHVLFDTKEFTTYFKSTKKIIKSRDVKKKKKTNSSIIFLLYDLTWSVKIK
jgi:hypothetical protein